MVMRVLAATAIKRVPVGNATITIATTRTMHGAIGRGKTIVLRSVGIQEAIRAESYSFMHCMP